MNQYPMKFEATAASASGINTVWQTQDMRLREVSCAIPPEFGGPGSGFSPEDLYLFALTNCFVATFKVIAEKSQIKFQDLHATSSLTLDKDESGVPWMQQADLQFTITGAENPDRTLRLLERVSKQCMIINSVKTKVAFRFSVEGANA